ncbi:MAG: hypothetical protein KAH32_00075 [Chlamydiia bacterium]|nr:hypothetical protein [Chlamydiia bacterium]
MTTHFEAEDILYIVNKELDIEITDKPYEHKKMYYIGTKVYSILADELGISLSIATIVADFPESRAYTIVYTHRTKKMINVDYLPYLDDVRRRLPAYRREFLIKALTMEIKLEAKDIMLLVNRELDIDITDKPFGDKHMFYIGIKVYSLLTGELDISSAEATRTAEFTQSRVRAIRSNHSKGIIKDKEYIMHLDIVRNKVHAYRRELILKEI